MTSLTILDEIKRHITLLASVEETGALVVSAYFNLEVRPGSWLVDDLYRFRILDIDDLTDPGICLAYPQRPYPEAAVILLGKVGEFLRTFRARLSRSFSPTKSWSAIR